jgi:hypothetical protein
MARQRCSECGERVHIHTYHGHSGNAARANHDLCWRHWRAARHSARAQGGNFVSGEYNAQIAQPFIPMVIVNWKGRRMKMNLVDYDEAKHGPILDHSLLHAPIPMLKAPAPDKDPRLDDQGRVIAEQHSPMLRA